MTQDDLKSTYRSGFAALIGRPNVGKSTLLNALVGQKVAIMSNRPQTTRHQIRGVLTTPEAQVIFIDTPGIHKPKHTLGTYMVEAAVNTLREVDLILFVVDVADPRPDADAMVVERLQSVQTPIFLIVNKVDLVPKPQILSRIDALRDQLPFRQVIPVSAKQGIQLDTLQSLIVQELPEGPQYYPEGMVTDHPEQFIIAEIVREKVLHLTREEVPHSVMVDIEQMEYRESSDTIYANVVIYCERDSQKGILIGRRGDMLKRVGQLARQELETLFGNKVYLELWVKVKKDWRNHPGLLHRFGFDGQ